MHHTSKTDPRRSLRHTPPTARTPQRTARVTRSGDVVRDDRIPRSVRNALSIEAIFPFSIVVNAA